MLIQNYFDSNFYYNDKKLVRCSYCNNLIFYINKNVYHHCPIENKGFEINENIIKEKDCKFICDINNIKNECVLHKKEFLYFKDSNYYCRDCLKEKKIKDYLNLDEISLSKEEINDFKKLIKNYENILLNIQKLNEEFINKLIESYERFEKRNKLLIKYCKDLIKFNEKYDNNYNLITTIRRISIDFKINQFKKLMNKDLIDFYDDNNIINFNNEIDYEFFFFLNQKIFYKMENII